MINIPHFKRLNNKAQLDHYANTYFQCSGLPVPTTYLHSPTNRVYGVFYKKQMIGGFILGNGQTLRTLEIFAQPAARGCLYGKMGDVKAFTEITCFWIAPQFRRSTSINTFVWLSLAFLLRCVGKEKILFGTCSASLAKLYSVTPRSVLLHRDEINGKRTFVYQSERKVSLQGFLDVLCYKWGRQVRIRRERASGSLRQVA